MDSVLLSKVGAVVKPSIASHAQQDHTAAASVKDVIAKKGVVHNKVSNSVPHTDQIFPSWYSYYPTDLVRDPLGIFFSSPGF